jgi:hypothetical protein
MGDANSAEPQDGLGSEVLASTLFWALLPIALNTMTQPSGRILGFPPWYNFALRISPIVCAVNAISTLVELLFRAYTFKSFKTAFLGIAAHRFKGASDAGTNEGRFENLRRNSVFRIGLFVLGALPQAVMLYASKGIPWAQSCCTAYLASFVLDELVLYFSSHPGDAGLDAYDEPLQYDDLLGRISSSVHRLVSFSSTEHFICCAGSFFDFCLFPVQFMNDAPVPSPATLGPFLLMIIVKEDSAHLLYWVGIWSCFFIGFDAAFQCEALAPLSLVIYGVGIGLIVLGIFGSMVEEKCSITAERIPRPLATYSLLNHVVASLVYLGLHYESKNTHRPYWTNWLG